MNHCDLTSIVSGPNTSDYTPTHASTEVVIACSSREADDSIAREYPLPYISTLLFSFLHISYTMYSCFYYNLSLIFFSKTILLYIFISQCELYSRYPTLEHLHSTTTWNADTPTILQQD